MGIFLHHLAAGAGMSFMSMMIKSEYIWPFKTPQNAKHEIYLKKRALQRNDNKYVRAESALKITLFSKLSMHFHKCSRMCWKYLIKVYKPYTFFNNLRRNKSYSAYMLIYNSDGPVVIRIAEGNTKKILF